MTLQEFNTNYVYQSDKAKYSFIEVWEVIEPNSDGKYLGDCESYCLTLIDKVDGFQDLELWYCKLNGVGHCVGRLAGMWIDCNMRRFVGELPNGYTEPRKYLWIEIVIKRLVGKLFSLWRK